MNARLTTLALLSDRGEAATICPSEVARALVAGADPQLATGDWRGLMPTVHAAVDELVAERLVRLSWKGRPLAARAGPYRIARFPR